MKRNQRPPKAPADAAEASALVRRYMIGLFDKQDGMAADWPLIAETLFRTAFEAVDSMPDDARRLSLLRRVHEGSYNRMTGSGAGEGGQLAPSETLAVDHPALAGDLTP